MALSNVLFVLVLGASKDYLALSDASVSWILVRVLACGALAVMAWWLATGQLAVKRAVEVRIDQYNALGLYLIVRSVACSRLCIVPPNHTYTELTARSGTPTIPSV